MKDLGYSKPEKASFQSCLRIEKDYKSINMHRK